jgi:hypothetical protein
MSEAANLDVVMEREAGANYGESGRVSGSVAFLGLPSVQMTGD